MRELNKSELKAISGASNNNFWTGTGKVIGYTVGSFVKYMPTQGYVAFN